MQKTVFRFLLLLNCAVLLSLPSALQAQNSFLDEANPFSASPVPTTDPFGTSATLERQTTGGLLLKVSFTVPPNHYLYNDSLRVETAGAARIQPQPAPPPHKKLDPITQQEVLVYDQNVTLLYDVEAPSTLKSLALSISHQGCNQNLCFRPTTTKLDLSLPASNASTSQPAVSSNAGPQTSVSLRQPDKQTESNGTVHSTPQDNWQQEIQNFSIVGKTEGYQKSEAFLEFLDRSQKADGAAPDTLTSRLENSGLWALIGLILIGGLALNLTPCVLPMIPINLAIIGAGARASSRGRGFALGGAYGAGMALTYGVLGLAAALTGARFGALNSSPWFNFAIAALFIFLALAMFDVFSIDFTRFRKGNAGGNGAQVGFFTVFLMGCVSALLAGACVAPVVIAVVISASKTYAAGNAGGLALPFLLGLGMALPWPFAGAGLSLLPKPGNWMNRVKQAFGVMILAFAVYYGYLGAGLLKSSQSASQTAQIVPSQTTNEEGWFTTLAPALAQARAENKPVFIDFWATWCKNCSAMDATTFRDPAVRARLEKDFIRVKFQAENEQIPGVRDALEYFQSIGLPTYVVLKPKP
jgi:thiol:disulfide interchange protein